MSLVGWTIGKDLGRLRVRPKPRWLPWRVWGWVLRKVLFLELERPAPSSVRVFKSLCDRPGGCGPGCRSAIARGEDTGPQGEDPDYGF